VNSDHLDGKYLWLYFSRNSAWDEALGLSTGGTPTSRNRLKEGLFLSLTIPLPPLADQRRIVARIEELSAKIEEGRIVRSQAIEEIKDLIASEEIQVWPHEALKDAPTLESVTIYLARGRQSTQGPSDHFLIKTQHVQMGRYVASDMTLAPWVANRVRDDALVRNGDVLIACSAAGCLGRVAFFEDHRGRIISTDTHVAIARANEERLLPEYLYAYLRGAQGQLQLRSREKGDWTREKVGFRFTELNVADMRRIPVPVPSLEEQRRIVAYLDGLQSKVDTVKKLQAESEAELDALMPSILSRAFRGEL
jgi:type I restriction enzyme S subunit